MEIQISPSIENKWNTFCEIFDELDKQILEDEYQTKCVERVLFNLCLGWIKNEDFFSQERISTYSTTKTVDIVIKKDGKPVVIVEIKRPNADTKNNENQLFDYMASRDLSTNFGLLIGEDLKFFYSENPKDNTPSLIFRTNFKKDSLIGVQFINLFSKSTFDEEKVSGFCKQRIKDLEAEKQAKEIEKQTRIEAEKLLANGAQIIREYFFTCLSEKYSEKIVEILKNRICIETRENKITNVVQTNRSESSKQKLKHGEKQSDVQAVEYLKRKIPSWFNNPRQINASTLIQYLKLSDSGQKSVSDKEMKDSGFPIPVSMRQAVQGADGLVFDYKKSDKYVELWENIREFIINEWTKHPELH